MFEESEELQRLRDFFKNIREIFQELRECACLTSSEDARICDIFMDAQIEL